MDPNETLKRIRGMMVQLMAGRLSAEDQNELAELIISLDGWLSKGGFLPEVWTRVTREQVDKLISKHEVRKAALTQDQLCPAKYGEFTCTLPRGHESKRHKDQSKSTRFVEWEDYVDECPICGRSDGKHDQFIHGRDHEGE